MSSPLLPTNLLPTPSLKQNHTTTMHEWWNSLPIPKPQRDGKPGLSELPESIGLCQQLVQLDLGGNALRLSLTIFRRAWRTIPKPKKACWSDRQGNEIWNETDFNHAWFPFKGILLVYSQHPVPTYRTLQQAHSGRHDFDQQTHVSVSGIFRGEIPPGFFHTPWPGDCEADGSRLSLPAVSAKNQRPRWAWCLAHAGKSCNRVPFLPMSTRREVDGWQSGRMSKQAIGRKNRRRHQVNSKSSRTDESHGRLHC